MYFVCRCSCVQGNDVYLYSPYNRSNPLFLYSKLIWEKWNTIDNWPVWRNFVVRLTDCIMLCTKHARLCLPSNRRQYLTWLKLQYVILFLDLDVCRSTSDYNQLYARGIVRNHMYFWPAYSQLKGNKRRLTDENISLYRMWIIIGLLLYIIIIICNILVNM